MASETRRRRGTALAVLGALAIVVPLGWLWQDSWLPATYSVMDMGYVDYGGGPPVPHDHGSGVSVADLTGPADRTPDVAVELVAREERVRLADGTEVDGFTLNGTSPGPEIRVRQGELLEIRLVNESVTDGTTLHWHGVDLPNAEDGVAGVTQDAVPVGASHVYRFVAEDAGTYWYHSHQVSHRQVRLGLFGVLVVEPAETGDTDAPDGPAEAGDPGGADVDVVAVGHTYRGVPTVNGMRDQQHHPAQPGDVVRVRIVNTDNAVRRVWVAGTGYQVVAVDGWDVHRPGPVADQAVQVPAGGRVDLRFTMPADGSAVAAHLGSVPVVFGPPGTAAPAGPRPEGLLDLLHYGEPAPIAFDPDRPDREFEYRVGRRPGFLDGRPGLFWTVNGHLYPDIPMYMVVEGDVVRMTISSGSGHHPMHLHGHHAVVLSRDGEAATGSPWWIDTLEVRSGETYEIAFVADNPGIWMDHCHNLPHARDGMIAHLAYSGMYTPFEVGGDAGNEPE